MNPIFNDYLKKRIYMKLIKQNGEKYQCVVASEEMSELQKELSKFIRGKGNRQNIIEEIADVEIMLEQLRIIFRLNEDEIQLAKNGKLHRLRKKINGGRYE